MADNNKVSILNGNTLELHYWFQDSSHTMDAFIQNRCEYELLNILKEVILSFNVQLSIETEPVSEGGLKRWFKIISKGENKKATITTAIIIALFTVLITTPISKISEKLIEKIFEDDELKKLEKEKLKLEIEKLKQDTLRNSQLLNESSIINKRKSNFYETIDSYPKINKISFQIESDDKLEILDIKSVDKSNFRDFILRTDDLPPLKVEDAVIEIISPVLKKGKYKWLGIYNGKPIHFNMKSEEFKKLVQKSEVEFKNGSSINCFLEIRSRINSEGIENIVGYDVIRVNHYFENDKPIETPEGKRHRQKKEAENRQLKLFRKE